MQESRLFKIIYYLLDKGHATAPELAAKFEVSVRTIYRDIDALSGAGVPVYAEAGRNGGIYLMNDFVLDRVVKTDMRSPVRSGRAISTESGTRMTKASGYRKSRCRSEERRNRFSCPILGDASVRLKNNEGHAVSFLFSLAKSAALFR